MKSVRDIFILMAGRGERFSKQNFAVPKPLIVFKGEPLFIWAIRSLGALLKDSQLYLVVCDEDDIQNKLRAELQKYSDLVTGVQIVSLKQRTGGPLESAYKALKQVSPLDRPLIFCDCDLFCESQQWTDEIKRWSAAGQHDISPLYDALLISFEAIADKHSFVKIDEHGKALAVAEKRPISNNAIAGFYAFFSSAVFEQITKTLVQRVTTKEKYISETYHKLIQDGKSVQTFKADKIILLGTPEELNQSKSP